MKRIFLLVCLILNVFVGSATTFTTLSNLKIGLINEKVTNSLFLTSEKLNKMNTPPCDVTATISYAGAPFCSSTTTPQNVTLTGTGVFTGGVFTSTVGLTINSNTGAITPSTSTSGSYTVTYTVSGGIGCPDAVATTTVAINTVPVVANQNITVCSDSALGVNFNSSSTVSVATYNVTALNLNGLTVSAGNAAVASGLVATDLLNDSFSNTVTAPVNVVYTVVPVSATGCQGNPFTVTVTVNPVPQLTPNPSFVYCNGDSTLSIPFSNINTGGTTTYAWTNSSTNIGLAASGVGNIPSFIANNPGSLPIVAAITVIPIFTNGSRSCTGPSRSVSITVNPSGQVTQPTSVIICSNASTNAIPFSTSNIGGTTTYTWTNSAPSIGLAASGSGNIPSFTALNSTSLTVIATITVTPTFSNGGVNCSGASKTFTITVNPRPNVPNQTVTVCSGNSFTVSPVNLPPSTIVPFGTTYTWTVVDNVNVSGESNQSVPQTTISQTLVNLTNTPQTVIYTVTPSSGTMINCVGNWITLVVTINPNATITTQPLAFQTACLNSTLTPLSFIVTNGNGTPTYQWYSNTINSTTGSTAIAGANNASYTPLTTSSGSIFYYCVATYPSGTCTTSTSSIAEVVVVSNQAPVIPAQQQTICSGTSFTVTPANALPTTIVPAGTTYTWTVVTNASVTGTSNSSVGQNNINQTLINLTNIPQTVVYTVTPRVGNCVTGAPFTITVTVNPRPIIPNQITVICSGGLFIINPINAAPTTIIPSGTTYTWTIAPNWNVTGQSVSATAQTGISQILTNLTNTVQTVVYSVTPISGVGNCVGSPFNLTVIVNPSPNIPSQTVTVCSGSTFTVSPVNGAPTTIVPSGTTYTWTVVDNVNVSGESNQSVPQTNISQSLTNLTNTVQTVVYIVTPRSGAAGNCVGPSFTVAVTLNPSIAIITGNTSVCINGTSQLTGTGTPIANNPWVSSNTTVATVNSTTGLVTGIAAGTCTIFYYTTNSSCLAQTTFTVNQTPAIQNQSATVCSGTPYTVNLINNAPNLIPTGTTYTWTVAPNPNVTGQSNQSVGQNSIVLTLTNTTSFLQTLVYTVTPRTSCNGAPFTLTVMVNPSPCSGFHLNAFLDSNNNGIQDAGENNFPFGQFIYQVNSSTHNVATVTGMYDIYESNIASIYTLRYSINPQLSPYFSVTPTSYTNVQIAATGGMTTYNFPITMNQLNDLGITLIPFGRPIPGFNFQNLILYTNYGTANSAGTITFTKHPALTIGSTSDPLGTTITPSGFNYIFSNLNPRQSKYLYVTMNTPTLPTVSLGQVLCNAATISPASGIDMISANNSSTNCSIVVGSYDPNDIAESRGREIEFNSFTSQDYLYYTIRFENTGTGNAINIKINNILNNRLDETTLEMVSSSHDYAMDRVNSAVNWNFSNIQLPPSVAQTNTGKGYIMYKIKPKPGYAIGDIIPNTASIYFDFNPAIITNTFETQFVTTLDTPNFEDKSFVVYPNPAKDQITIDLGNKSTSKDWNYKIVNTLGQEVLNGVLNSQQNIIELNNIKGQGVYFVKIYDGSNSLLDTKKIIIQK